MPTEALTAEEQVRSLRTIDLTGLDRIPGHPAYSNRDRRWKKRNEVWAIALRRRQTLSLDDTENVRELIKDISVGQGFWSVWMTVFADDADMCRRFREAFPGTAPDCWDETGAAICRPGGAI
jgi:hypothetical protein